MTNQILFLQIERLNYRSDQVATAYFCYSNKTIKNKRVVVDAIAASRLQRRCAMWYIFTL